MEADELRALGALRTARGVFARFIDRHHGRIANTAGDGLIAEFPSVVEAVQCAIEVQRELGARRDDPDGGMSFRIGIHLGDVIVDGDDLLGEGVNLAARLQSMAEPGDVLISQQVYDQVHAKLSVGFDYVGDRRPKNYAREVAVYRVAGGTVWRGAGTASPSARGTGSARPPDAAGPGRALLQRRLRRHAGFFGTLWLGLLFVDLGTGAPFWAHWPAIAIGVLLGLEAAPLLARGWFSRGLVRSAVIIAGLAAVNLVTWSGYPWVMWPIGALLALHLFRRFGTASR